MVELDRMKLHDFVSYPPDCVPLGMHVKKMAVIAACDTLLELGYHVLMLTLLDQSDALHQQPSRIITTWVLML